MKPLRKLYTNSHYPLTLRYLDKDKQPIPLTGYTAELVVRKRLFDGAAITKSATVTPEEGLIEFVIEPADTEGVLGEDASATFLIGATMTSPEGNVTTLFQSTIEIQENIVRP
ncbi:MAG: hypothetical protein AXW14_08470 [Alteromonas sp. Nap_26]|nr:MAG: hypothetical protein AXW14_08470 [Alteromonas sp. Nap_26]